MNATSVTFYDCIDFNPEKPDPAKSLAGRLWNTYLPRREEWVEYQPDRWAVVVDVFHRYNGRIAITLNLRA